MGVSTRTGKVGNSAFAMWRAVFAFAFVDNTLSLEEQELLHSYLVKVPFSPEQIAILRDDMRKPKDVVSLYQRITEPEDRRKFCTLARALVWCEGDMDRQEEAVLRRVSCLETAEERKYLRAKRYNLHAYDYYRQYAKAGVAGLLKAPSRIYIRV